VSFLRSLHQQFPKPKAILAISAHWHTDPVSVSLASAPKTIYDFSGFAPELYQLSYPVSGAPEVGDRIAQLLTEAGFEHHTDPSRGLDHGVWPPLLLVYRIADIPLTQLSVQYHRDPVHHYNLGKVLEPLRHEGVLIIGSGSVTHNLYGFNPQYDAEAPDWVQQFDHWLAQTIAKQDWDSLLHYRKLAPYAEKNHPTEEHLLPLFTVLGAGGTGVQGKQLHRSYTYGAFSMAAYAFE